MRMSGGGQGSAVAPVLVSFPHLPSRRPTAAAAATHPQHRTHSTHPPTWFLNWLMSKPGEKLLLAPATTMALHWGLACARRRLSNRLFSTACVRVGVCACMRVWWCQCGRKPSPALIKHTHAHPALAPYHSSSCCCV